MKTRNKLLALLLALVTTVALAVTAAAAEEATRWTVVENLYRLAGSPEVTGENPFEDVSDDASYRNAIIWAYESKVVMGRSETVFDPNASITRQETATLLYRYAQSCCYDVSEDTDILCYIDAASVSEYAIPAFQWACAVGLFEGTENSELLPLDAILTEHLDLLIKRFTEIEFAPAAKDSAAILDAAYSLAEDTSMTEVVTLTGVITQINTAWSEQYQNITVTIVVDGRTDLPIVCYRLKGEGAADLIVGDTITVTGTIINYKGTIEFGTGCVVDTIEKTGVAPEAPAFDVTDAAAVLEAAYALAEGEALTKEITLTGVITEVGTAWSEQFKNITVTIVVGDNTEKPIVCYRLKGDGAADLAVGDTITVTGTIINYKGTIEFNSGCILTAVTKA